MQAFLDLPGFMPLALFSVLLVLKMGAIAFSTANRRRLAKVVLNPEDVGVNPGSHAEPQEAPETMRAKRAHLYDRMVDAGMTPDHPRPAPPPMRRAALTLAISFAASAAALMVTMSTVANARPDDETGRLAVVAATGGYGPVLGDLALDAWRRHDLGASVALYRVAMEASPRDVYLAANLAIVLSDAGRCAESARVFEEVSRRFTRHEQRDEDTDAERVIADSAGDAVQQCVATVGR